MKLQLINVEKFYNYNPIFKSVNFVFEQNNCYGIKGKNGAGKTTLLKILANYIAPSNGELLFTKNNKVIPFDDWYSHISIVSPAMEMPLELTAKELLTFQQQFKPWQNTLTIADILQLLQLQNTKNKHLNEYSTGMLQRVKLVAAICCQSDILLLDEPTSNLDEQGIAWYTQLLQQFNKNRIVIIASNQSHDFVNVNQYLTLH